MDRTKDKAQGCIVGAAIGDALGMPAEFMTESELKRHYGRIEKFESPLSNHPLKNLKPGQWTDDTQLLLLTADSLIESKGFDIYDFSERLGEWWRRCEKEKGYNRYASMNTLNACKALYYGNDPYKSGSKSIESDSVVRSIPTGVWYYRSIEDVVRYSRLSSVPTHNSEETKEACLALALTCTYLLNDLKSEEALKSCMNYLSHKKLIKRFNTIIDMQEEEPDRVKNVLGLGTSVMEVVPLAFYSFLHSQDNFEDIVLTAVNASGDTDTLGAIAGALGGAYLGISKIPPNFLEQLEAINLLKNRAVELIEKSNYLKIDFDLKIIQPENLNITDRFDDEYEKIKKIIKTLEKETKEEILKENPSIQYLGLELGKELVHHYKDATLGDIEVCSMLKKKGNRSTFYVRIEDRGRASMRFHRAITRFRDLIEGKE